jgi:hypothetical protein
VKIYIPWLRQFDRHTIALHHCLKVLTPVSNCFKKWRITNKNWGSDFQTNICKVVGPEVLTVVSTKMAVFWVVAPCSLVEIYHRFRGHRPVDGGSKDLWNVGKILPDYTPLQPRRQPSSFVKLITRCLLQHRSGHIPPDESAGFIFNYGLFNDAVSSSDYTVSDRTINEFEGIWKEAAVT